MLCKICGEKLKGEYCSNCGAFEEGFTGDAPAAETLAEPVVLSGEGPGAEEPAVQAQDEEIMQEPYFSVAGPILVAAGALFACPLFNLVSIITAIISIVNANKSLSLFHEKRYNESMACYNKAKAYFKWSWISLIISVAVSFIAAAVVFFISLYQSNLVL